MWREQTWPERGLRLKLSQAIGCQPSYISQILNGNSHLSLEQAVSCQDVLGHTLHEIHFFMLLLQFERAGNSILKEYFLNQISKLREERKLIDNRIGQKTGVSKKDQTEYYGNHLNALIHIALTIPELQTPESISKRLCLPLDVVRETLSFLVSCHLAEEKNGKYEGGSARLHLSRESKLINKHHSNWRIKALENLDLASKRDLHYSSVLSFSLSDWTKLREMIVSAISEIQSVVKDSPAEELFVFNIDLFQVKK